ncbi:MAG TPA: hypothetical protein VK775_18095 [Chthoniobacterales bacterium]|nr:hypothetical protein [Chthoniobacterales bacterium]
MNQAEMTHCGRSHSSDCCEDHGAAFEHRLRTGKDGTSRSFFLAKAIGLRQVLDKMLELDISPNHLSGFDLGEYERLFERC